MSVVREIKQKTIRAPGMKTFGTTLMNQRSQFAGGRAPPPAAGGECVLVSVFD
jgi:hypothetical protein